MTMEALIIMRFNSALRKDHFVTQLLKIDYQELTRSLMDLIKHTKDMCTKVRVSQEEEDDKEISQKKSQSDFTITTKKLRESCMQTYVSSRLPTHANLQPFAWFLEKKPITYLSI